MSQEVRLTNDNFDAEVLKADIPVLVDFWAEWCMPCKMIGPVVESLAEEFAGRLKVAKLNVDEAGETASQYNVISIPTLMVFSGGKVVKTQVGAVSKDAILALFEDQL